MARRLTYEEVKSFIEVESGSGCELLSKEYMNAKNKLGLTCRCGNKFETNFNNFKSSNKRQCNDCGEYIRITSTKKTNKEFTKEIQQIVGDEYVFLDGYINTKTKILCKHSVCGYEWYITPDNFFNWWQMSEM